jgi:uncharacterized protein
LPPTSTRDFVDNSVDPHVHGFLHLPENPNGSGLVLTHGAGSNAQSPLLIALAETFSAAGFTVLRCNLPYRQTRPFGPPGPGDAARDRAGLKNAIASLKKILGEIENPGAPFNPAFGLSGGFDHSNQNLGAPVLAAFARSGDFLSRDPDQPQSQGKIYLGGHSYGGRQCSMLCAEQPDLADGLLLLSYPLHPPRKPEQQRTQHLPNLHTPALFVHGARDAFGTIAEMEHAMKMIPAKTNLLPIEGAGHDLGFKGKTKKEELPGLIFSEFAKFLSS